MTTKTKTTTSQLYVGPEFQYHRKTGTNNRSATIIIVQNVAKMAGKENSVIVKASERTPQILAAK